MSTAKVGDLETQIEELVREHVAALRRRATLAMERAFGQTPPGKNRSQRVATSARQAGRRRGPEEVVALGERLYAAICARPGASMTVLASELGATPRELNRPATQLRQAGRVRTVGQRQATRYFPLNGKTARGSQPAV